MKRGRAEFSSQPIEKVKKTQTIKKMFASASQSKQEQNDIKVVSKGRNNPNETISAALSLMLIRGKLKVNSSHQILKRGQLN